MAIVGSILYASGVLLVALALFLLAPCLFALIEGEQTVAAWLMSAWISGFIGTVLILCGDVHRWRPVPRESTAIIVVAWCVVGLFASLPFAMVLDGVVFVDALFEGISGVTATGASVFSVPEQLPRSILLWRGMLQWLGGLGVVVVVIVVLPMLQVGGLQLFRFAFQEDFEKNAPRITRIGRALLLFYLGNTLFSIAVLFSLDVPLFEAVCVVFSAVSTGGFSPYSGSIAQLANPYVEWFLVFVMITSSVPLLLLIAFLSGRVGGLLRDQQTQTFLILVCSVVLVTVIWHRTQTGISWEEAVRVSAFNVTSVFTGTGFTSADFSSWSSFLNAVFLVCMLIGGCSGSTTCGLKVFRAEILFRAVRAHWQRILQPHRVAVITYNERVLHEDTILSVSSFLLTYITVYICGCLILSLIGLDGITAMSAMAATIANVGVGLGETVGPNGSFALLPMAGKWVLIVSMLLGRLELIPMLLIASPAFWRR